MSTKLCLWYYISNKANKIVNKKNTIWILIMMLTISSCLPDGDNDVVIEAELMPYFENFKAEAMERGITVDYQEIGLGGKLQDLSEDGILGQCVHDNLSDDQVLIDISFWNNNNNMSREFIVFHELGHCFLDRGHDDKVDNKGKCVSIMNSGSVNCRSNYTSSTREAYLNELFN